jgi:hypothetical protein
MKEAAPRGVVRATRFLRPWLKRVEEGAIACEVFLMWFCPVCSKEFRSSRSSV